MVLCSLSFSPEAAVSVQSNQNKYEPMVALLFFSFYSLMHTVLGI